MIWIAKDSHTRISLEILSLQGMRCKSMATFAQKNLHCAVRQIFDEQIGSIPFISRFSASPNHVNPLQNAVQLGESFAQFAKPKARDYTDQGNMERQLRLGRSTFIQDSDFRLYHKRNDVVHRLCYANVIKSHPIPD